MGCCSSNDDSRRSKGERPLDDPIHGASAKKRRASESLRKPKDKEKPTKAAAPIAAAAGALGAPPRTTPQGRALTGELLQRLLLEESAERSNIAAAQERQRNMHTFDFEKLMPLADNRVPGSMSTIDFETPDDDDEPEDRPRRSTMNSHEYDAAKNMRKVHLSKDHSPRSGATPVAPLSMAGVRRHDSEDDCWVVIRGRVYDVTALLDIHPGGAYAIYQHGGTDATRAFEDAHTRKPMEHLERYYKGDVTPN